MQFSPLVTRNSPLVSRHSGFRSQHRRHALAFHRRVLLNLRHVGELFEDAEDDALALFKVLQFAATEEDVDQHLVLMLEEFPRLIDFGFDVGLAGFRPDADFFQLVLVRLLLAVFARLLVAILPVVHDLADGRALRGRDFDQVEVGFAGHVERVGSWHDAHLFAGGADEPDWADADLVVDAWAEIAGWRLHVPVGRWDSGISFRSGEPGLRRRAATR